MNHSYRTLTAIGLAALTWAGAMRRATASDILFTDPTRVNVLREYNLSGSNLVVRTMQTAGGASDASDGTGNDGSGNKLQANGFIAGTSAGETFVFPAPRTISSYKFQNIGSYNPTSMTLSGLVNGVWTVLDPAFNPGTATSITHSFTPTTVSAVKYVGTGPGQAGNFLQVSEIQVFEAPGVSQPLYGRVADGAAMNLLRDSGMVSGTANSTQILGTSWLAPDATPITGWVAPSAGSASSLFDADYTGGVKAQSIAGGASGANPFAYAKIDLSQSVNMNLAHFGWYDGQQWDNWAFYVSNLASPSANNPADWLKIYSSVAAVGPDFMLNFGANAGSYQHILLLWEAHNGAGGQLDQLEIFGFVPEPSTILLLGFGGWVCWAKRRRLSR